MAQVPYQCDALPVCGTSLLVEVEVTDSDDDEEPGDAASVIYEDTSACKFRRNNFG